MITQFLLNGLITGLLYALLAIAFSLVYNTTKIFHIAFAGVLVAASFIFYTFSVQWSLPFVIALVACLMVTGILNLGIEYFIYKRLEDKKVNHNNILVASIGVFIVITNLLAMGYGNETKTFPSDIKPSIQVGSLIITYMQVLQGILCSLLILGFLWILRTTDLGIKIKALSNNLNLFEVLGHSAAQFRMILFFMSGVLAAIISLLMSFDVGFDPYFGMSLLLNALVAMIIGGFGSFKGSVLGGIILGLIQSVSIYFFESRWETAISFLLLILILILGRKDVRRKTKINIVWITYYI
jgi:branched-chain amino acid transport system permease protein